MGIVIQSLFHENAGERSSLGGTFFIRPVGAVFADPSGRKPPERKPTVRIFVLICTRVSE